MNDLRLFQNELFEITATVENGQILFDAEKVARCLGFTEMKGEKEYVRWRTINGYLRKYISQDVAKGSLIPEPMVYKLAFKASNEVAEQFQDFLSIEVIPSIRRDGGYIAVSQDDDENTIMAKALLVAHRTIEQNQNKLKEQQQTIDIQRPKVAFADAVGASQSTILIRELAKLITQNGVKTGEKILFQWLRQNGYLIKTGTDYNSPTQKAMNLGLFRIKETCIVRSDGNQIAKTTTVTPKGQIYFINKFLEMKETKCLKGGP